MKQQATSESDARRHERMAEHVDETYQTRGVPEDDGAITAGTLVPEHDGPAERTSSGAGLAPRQPEASLSERQTARGEAPSSPSVSEEEEKE